jgi:hypothetical protein
MQIHREQIASNFQRAQTQAAVTQAYHEATLGMAKNRLDLEGQKLQQTTQTKAKEISDTVGLANFVAKGGTLLDGIAQYPSGKLPATAEKTAKPPMSDYARTMHSDLASAYKDALKTGDMTKVGSAAKMLREFDEKQNPQGLVQPSAPAVPGAPATAAPAAAPNGGTGVIGTPQNNQFQPAPTAGTGVIGTPGQNQFINPAASYQAATGGTPATPSPQTIGQQGRFNVQIVSDGTSPALQPATGIPAGTQDSGKILTPEEREKKGAESLARIKANPPAPAFSGGSVPGVKTVQKQLAEEKNKVINQLQSGNLNAAEYRKMYARLQALTSPQDQPQPFQLLSASNANLPGQ